MAWIRCEQTREVEEWHVVQIWTHAPGGRGGEGEVGPPEGSVATYSEPRRIRLDLRARATYDRPDFALFDFNVFALCGDGDVMEGIASEAAWMAGHLWLSNLCWIYHSNRVAIEGYTDITFSEDVAARFLAYG